MKKNFLSINIPKLQVCTTELGIEIIKSNINRLGDWKSLPELVPSKFKKTSRLKKSGYTDEQIKKIFGPIGIKLGGNAAPEIAVSIISQLVSEVYKKT